MADTTPTTPIKFGPVATKPTTYSTRALHGGETATQTFKRGAFVQYSAAGRVSENAAPLVAATDRTLGISQAAATGTTDKSVLIDDAKHTHFEMTLSTTASAHTLVLADLGSLFTISRDSASKNWYLQDVAATEANGGGFVVQIKDPLGTVDGRVIVRVTKAAIQGA